MVALNYTTDLPFWTTFFVQGCTFILQCALGNLSGLELYNCNISDISALSGLTNLTFLDLWHNNISDISALSGLTNLTSLDLTDNNISDISALSGLTNLTDLSLAWNNISDISALSGLTNLTWLELCNNNISDISALCGLQELYSIDLTCNFSDAGQLEPLTQIPNLRYVDIEHLIPEGERNWNCNIKNTDELEQIKEKIPVFYHNIGSSGGVSARGVTLR